MKPSARRILNYLQENGTAFSWELAQAAKTADYRKRISELNAMGYRIESFVMPWKVDGKIIQRHGYALVGEPE